MQKNWYAVYTKPQSEKKVAALFVRKKIDVFFPMVHVKTKTFRKDKFIFEPLFKSIVFVCVTQEETALLFTCQVLDTCPCLQAFLPGMDAYHLKMVLFRKSFATMVMVHSPLVNTV